MTETNSPPDVAEEPASADADRTATVAAPRSIGDLWRMIAKLSTGTIARGAIWGLLITGGGIALGMLSQVALARQLGTAGFGVYLYVMAAMNALSIIARLELDTAAVRFVGAYHATHAWGLLRGFLHKSRRWVTSMAGGLAVLAAAVILLVQRWLPAGYTIPLLIGCLILPAASRLQVEAGYLQGLRRVRESQAPFQLLRPIVLCITVLGVGASAYRLSVPLALLLQLLATTTALVVTMRLMARNAPREISTAVEVDDSREWVRTIGPLMVIAISQLVLSTQTDVLVVNAFLGKEATAVYGTASQLAALSGLAFTALMLIVQPQIARLFAQRRVTDLQRLVSWVQLASLLVSLAAFLVLVLFGKWALGWFGRDFRAGYPVMLVLALGQICLSTVGAIAGYLLTMTGHQREASRVIAGTAVENLVLTLVLTPLLGLIGVALATGIAVVTRAVILAVIVRRIVGVSLIAMPQRLD
jgi:O-antigen/teichoic acid export membrane protein